VKARIALLIFSLLTILEGAANFFIYLLFLEKRLGVLDIAVPFYFRALKIDRDYGKDI
jgi:hypothetical protein